MQTLSEPLYEINQESEYYKKAKWKKDQNKRINEIIDELANELGFDGEEFRFYGSGGFGFEYNSNGYEKFKDQLTKNPDSNGIYTFKKSSKTYKIANPKLIEIDKIQQSVSPFALHDIFGWNNLKASQWIDDRLFIEVKNSEVTVKKIMSESRSKQYPIEPVKEIPYKEYLQLILNFVE